MTRILILGGGFGGVYAALRLQARLSRRQDIHVTLVSRDNYFLFTPMLPQAATSSIDTRHIVQTIRRICPHVKLLQAEIEAIDLATRTVTISHAEGHRHQLGFDQLLIAIGGVTNYFGLPGVAEFALPVKTLTDAIRIRNHALDMLEQAELEEDADLRKQLLTFVVAGAGFAGVETAAELDVFVRRASAQYSNFTAADIRTVILDAQSRVLPELSEQLAAFTASTLEKRGMEVRMNVSVRAADADGVDLADGTRIRTRTFIWAGGVGANPLIAHLGITNARGRIPVDANLSVPGHPGIWAIGDCAQVLPAPDAKPYPPTAQHALREGSHVAGNMLALADGKPLKPFAFTMIGQMANLGERSAVAMVGGFKLSGFPAWWLWRTYYLTRIPTLERKLRVAIDWTLDLLFSRDTVKLSMPADQAH
ncbi:MAG TPA: NAD(P)/FAD-dependent oxidoreductase [Candidatus Eremiobacteraceae bacterium]|nr:NAD(P)/FAD-dependent oxidoreductase [Candidatus Eremiobacteraceae bacterium]